MVNMDACTKNILPGLAKMGNLHYRDEEVLHNLECR